ncbi:MAG: SPOR domain-containing protein, partial [bacterium]|nr:SPOR domain-containing protein [bacterium]
KIETVKPVETTAAIQKKPETTAVRAEIKDTAKIETVKPVETTAAIQKKPETTAVRAEIKDTAKIETVKPVETTAAIQKKPETTAVQEEKKISYIPPRKIKQIWTVEIASDKDKVWASNFTDKINKANTRNYAYVKKVIINGTIWYTIRAGLFNDEKEAKQLGENLKANFEEIKEYNVILIK